MAFTGSAKKRKAALFDLADLSRKKQRSKSDEGSETSRKKKRVVADVMASAKKQPLDGKACGFFSKLIDTGVVKEDEIVQYIRKRDQSVMKEGTITRNGVSCLCCGEIFQISKFEVHAGSTLHRPSTNMFLLDGRSIAACQLQAGNPPKPKRASRSEEEDNSDTICEICNDGGELMLCDGCPSVFHYKCLKLDQIPDGKWFCSKCQCRACGEGTCIGKQKVRSCTQCHAIFHDYCINHNSQYEYEGYWFCKQHCLNVFRKLRMMVGKVNYTERGLSWILLRSFEEDEKDGNLSATKKAAYTDYNAKLSSAVQVLHECFEPIVDQGTKIDLITQAAFNRKAALRRLDCSGFYSLLLFKGDQLVCVANVRIHGTSLAEMPFIGTRHMFRQQGMCRVLMQAIEKMLKAVRVKRLILPAVPDLQDTWIGSFGFKYLDYDDQRAVSQFNLMTFPGTNLLQKKLPCSEEQGAANPLDIDQEGTCLSYANFQHEELYKVGRGSLGQKRTAGLSSHPVSCH